MTRAAHEERVAVTQHGERFVLRFTDGRTLIVRGEEQALAHVLGLLEPEETTRIVGHGPRETTVDEARRVAVWSGLCFVAVVAAALIWGAP